MTGPINRGTLNEDELADVAINLKSKRAIADLRSLVGDEIMGKAARRHIETAWADAPITSKGDEIVGFNWIKLKKDLGLTGKGKERDAIQEFLKGSGVDFKDLEELIDTASKIEVPASLHQFLARRAGIGGFSALMGAVTATGVITADFLSSISAALLIRYGARIISDPQQLRMMRRTLAPNTPSIQKRALIGRIFRIVGELEQDPAFTQTGQPPPPEAARQAVRQGN